MTTLNPEHSRSFFDGFQAHQREQLAEAGRRRQRRRQRHRRLESVGKIRRPRADDFPGRHRRDDEKCQRLKKIIMWPVL